MKSLGQTLREARELIPFTLRQVEDATGISNAYLSQLENDKIKKPSANVLYKLSAILKVELQTLLKAAGIITEQSEQESEVENSEWAKRIAFYSDNLTEAQRNEVLQFIQFMKSKK